MSDTFVFVINSLGAGGAERSLADTLPHVAERGIRPVVVCFKAPDVGFEREVRDAGTEVIVLPNDAGLLGQVRGIRRVLKRERPSLLYTALFDAHLAGRLAAVGTRVPVLSNITNIVYDPARFADPRVNDRKLRILRTIDGWTARHLTSHFHAVSGAVKDSIVESLRLDPDDVTVIRRGRSRKRLGDPSEHRRAETRRQLGIDAQVPVLITVGRQEYQKGHLHLLKAIPMLLEAWPDLQVLIVGRNGHMSVELRQLVDDLGIAPQVRFLGHRSDVADLLCAADLFVFPSVYEGLGGANLEAMAMGLPMIVSDIPALREVVEDGRNGVLVPPADPDSIARAVDRLLADGDRRVEFGRRSIEIYEKRFRADEAIPQSVDLMVAVAKKGR